MYPEKNAHCSNCYLLDNWCFMFLLFVYFGKTPCTLGNHKETKYKQTEMIFVRNSCFVVSILNEGNILNCLHTWMDEVSSFTPNLNAVLKKNTAALIKITR